VISQVACHGLASNPPKGCTAPSKDQWGKWFQKPGDGHRAWLFVLSHLRNQRLLGLPSIPMGEVMGASSGMGRAIGQTPANDPSGLTTNRKISSSEALSGRLPEDPI
jgi:hypothetical protein